MAWSTRLSPWLLCPGGVRGAGGEARLCGRGGQWWSAVVSGGQRWSVVVSGGQRWSVVVSGGQWWSMVVSGGQWWSQVVNGGQLSVISGSQGGQLIGRCVACHSAF